MDAPMIATVVAAEFVTDGDPHRDDMDDPPREAGTYVTVLLDDDGAAIVGGKVQITYLPKVVTKTSVED